MILVITMSLRNASIFQWIFASSILIWEWNQPNPSYRFHQLFQPNSLKNFFKKAILSRNNRDESERFIFLFFIRFHLSSKRRQRFDLAEADERKVNAVASNRLGIPLVFSWLPSFFLFFLFFFTISLSVCWFFCLFVCFFRFLVRQSRSSSLTEFIFFYRC